MSPWSSIEFTSIFGFASIFLGVDFFPAMNFFNIPGPTHLSRPQTLNLVPQTVPFRRQIVASNLTAATPSGKHLAQEHCGAPDKMGRGFHIHLLSLDDIHDPMGK